MSKSEKKGSGTKGSSGSAGKAKEKLGRRDRAIRDLDRFETRATKMVDRVAKRFASAGDDVTHAIGAIGTAVRANVSNATGALRALPADWQPTRGPSASLLAAGCYVQVREKVAEKYDGLIPTGAKLAVVDVRKAIVGVKTPTGERVFVPRGHLILASA